MEIDLPTGARLRYEDVGAGPPLLLLHAFPLGAAMWRPQLAALAGRCRLIAPDLRGFGGSPAAPAAESLDDHADDMAALLDALGLRRVALAGLSMGGYIAFAMLRRHAARVGALLLADTRPGPDGEAARAARAANAAIALREGSAALAARLLPGLVAPGAPGDLRAELLAIAAANPPAGVAAALRAMAARPDSTPDLAAIRVPTTIVVGAEDAVTPPGEARAMHAAIAGSRLVEIAGAGHLSASERPAEFSAALAALIDTP